MPLEDIRVVVEAGASPYRPDALSGHAAALLHELGEHVRRLLATGESTAIDLNGLPLTPADLDWLQAKLGKGEVSVTLEADGESTLQETACAGVWWVTHRNGNGQIVSRFLEVAYVPELVGAHPEDVQTGLEYLESLFFDLS